MKEEKKKKYDMVNSPAHYTQGKYEVIDIIVGDKRHERYRGSMRF